MENCIELKCEEQLSGGRVVSVGWARLACLGKTSRYHMKVPDWPRVVGKSWPGTTQGLEV